MIQIGDSQEDFDSGKIQLRDKWQFELKSHLFPLSYHSNNIINQEFYIFLPNSLQINEETYSKTQFYKDQTNLIRLKTPSFNFQELLDPENVESPFVRIQTLIDKPDKKLETAVFDEIKLLGTIFHSTLRDSIASCLSDLDSNRFHQQLSLLCDQVKRFQELLTLTKNISLDLKGTHELEWTFSYIEEYIRFNMHHYFSRLLFRLREKKLPDFENLDRSLCQFLLDLEEQKLSKPAENKDLQEDEYVLYRKGLLTKFVIDPLLLNVTRTSFSQRYRNLLGAIPAGVAMLFYLLILFSWQGRGNFLFINSQSIILLMVILYILKDRIKEELKNISHQKAAQWFADYTTEIKSPNEKSILGILKESFSFISEDKVPNEVIEMRNRQFHSVLEAFKRPEKIIYYKKVVNIKKKPKSLEARFYGLNIIFRMDIHHFLTKAEDPLHDDFMLDSTTLELRSIQLSRVYHVNIILKSTTLLPTGKEKIVWDKYRLVVNKNGINRIEVISSIDTRVQLNLQG